MIFNRNKINNNLPTQWIWTNLSEIAEIILGQSPSSSTYNIEGIGLPFYQGKKDFGDIYPVPHKWCTSPKKTAEKEDVLISIRAPVGSTNICSEKSCIGRGLAAIRPLGGIQSLFILYLLRTFEQEISEKAIGTTFGAINRNQLKQIPIPLPPLAEQHRIVAKIEELFTKLDAGVEALKKAKEQIKRYRQSVLKYAFEGKLTEEWRKENKDKLEPASVLIEKIKAKRKEKLGKKYKELPPIDTSELPEPPEGWVWVRLGESCEIIMGQSPSSKTYNYAGIGIPFYQGKAEFGNIYPTRVKWCSIPVRIAEKNDILLSIRAPVGPTNICPETSCIGRGLCAIRYELNELSRYIFYYLRSIESELSKKGTGSTFSAISRAQIENLLIPFAPLPEQHQIVSEIERRFAVADAVEKVIDNSLKQAERLRQSILKKAFEGKLVPQDPNDEPASELLKRIKESKENMQSQKSKNKGKK
ncbi:MAG: restriction endonuclease subunit S [candidate division WOR-3 bacterium]